MTLFIAVSSPQPCGLSTLVTMPQIPQEHWPLHLLQPPHDASTMQNPSTSAVEHGTVGSCVICSALATFHMEIFTEGIHSCTSGKSTYPIHKKVTKLANLTVINSQTSLTLCWPQVMNPLSIWQPHDSLMGTNPCVCLHRSQTPLSAV